MFFDPYLLQRCIGVIDLQNGKAVRAVAGKRDRYEPVRSFRQRDGKPRVVAGDPQSLLHCYLEAGVESIYVADLNAIRFATPQRTLLESLLHSHANCSGGMFLFDIGVNGFETVSQIERINRWLSVHPHARLVIGCESAQGAEATLQHLCDIPFHRLAVSFDFQGGGWMSDESVPDEWAMACRKHNIDTVIGLDLAAVGGESISQTAAVCRFLSTQVPNATRISGGRIRNAIDARRLLDEGADRLLVASLFVGGNPIAS